MRITHMHSLDGDTYVYVLSHKYCPLANVNICEYIIRTKRNYSIIFKYFRIVSIR